MQKSSESLSPPAFTTEDIKQCGVRKDLARGKFLHSVALRYGCDDNLFLANTLVWMYSRCGRLHLAEDVFHRMISHDVVSWTTLIMGYVENRDYYAALQAFAGMDCVPDRIVFHAAVRACSALAKQAQTERKRVILETVVDLHRQAGHLGFDRDLMIATSLMDVYGKCGDMLRARDVFDRMEKRSVVSWNVLMLGYVDNRESDLALEVFHRMDCVPDHVTFVAAAKACAMPGRLEDGVRIHTQAKELGFDKSVNVANTLVDMYAKCGDMALARRTFDGISKRSVVSWNVLMFGYLGNSEKVVALEIFDSMDCAPNCVSFVAALKACASMVGDGNREVLLQRGVRIHMRIKELGFDRDVELLNTLMEMYCKCGDMNRAHEVFTGMAAKSTASWNVLILGYVNNEQSSVALDVYSCMDCRPNHISILAALKACGRLVGENDRSKTVCHQQGMIVHSHARALGLHRDVRVANALIDMYSKCGNMHSARDVFDEVTSPTVVSWSALILGYVENEQSLIALEQFDRMDCSADSIAFVAALKACGNLGALEKGKSIHNIISERGLEEDESVSISLVDFYSKCGRLAEAEDIFRRTNSKSTVMWNALMSGYVLLGCCASVFHLVESMREKSVPLDAVTMLLILTACNHMGLVNEAYKYLELMSLYNINPTVEHYGCMVDMLGRANKLDEALLLVNQLTCSRNTTIWTSLLAASLKCNHKKIGRVAYDALRHFEHS